MKNYLLFAGRDFYPIGGACDFKGAYDNFEDAVKEGQRLTEPAEGYKFYVKNDWFHVFSNELQSIIVGGGEVK